MIVVKKLKKIESLIIVVIFIIILLLISKIPMLNTFSNKGKLIINEVLSSNKNIDNGYDYIEIYNGYDYEIDLENYYLSDDTLNLRKWKFPSITIKPDEYLVVYASGLDKYEEGKLHTNFKLSKNGEVVTLSDKDAKALSRIYYKETLEDTSYGYNEKKYVYYYNPTPGYKNEGYYQANQIKLSKNNKYDILITEYLIGNKSNYSLLEIYNDSKEDINIKDYYLSNKLDDIYIYKFPDVTIKSKKYLVVYATGLNKYEEGKIHTNFELKSDDKYLVLSDKKKNIIQKVSLKYVGPNISSGIYNENWHYYKENSIGSENKDNYILNLEEAEKDVRVNEVISIGEEAIELKNLTDTDINLKNYSISDKNSNLIQLPDMILSANSYIVLYGSDNYSYSNGKVYLGFHINNSDEIINLYKNNQLIDTFEVGMQINGVSSGIDESGKRVFYKENTLGYKNSNNYYEGYSLEPVFSIDGGYVEKGTEIKLKTSDDSELYYTLDGSFPSLSSNKYTGPIEINKTMVLKVVAYKDNYLPSNIVSRTYIVGRKHENKIISISTENYNLYGSSGIISNYKQNVKKIINFELYESNGKLGISFVGDTKLSGMDSREQPQKSMSVYLRKIYGLKEVTYPFFKDCDTVTYSSLLIRNSGEDPKGVRIMDAALTRALKEKMDIDFQEYTPVVVYINGEYYGIYSLREKLNADYVESKYNIDKDDINFIKYSDARRGSIESYNSIVNYIKTHDVRDKENYEYIKSQIDIQEMINYLIVESYYGNTDLGNIKYWKSNTGKWRFMLYDLDWSMWNSGLNMSYTVYDTKIPAITYLYSIIEISRKLYQNDEYRDLYLSTLNKHLSDTFKPSRINSIVDELASEIEYEMPYHIKRWGSEYSNLNSMDRWKSNIESLKAMVTDRYNNVLHNLKNDFKLSNEEYQKYFGDLE